MSQLAKALQEKGHRLKNPIDVTNKARKAAGLSVYEDIDTANQDRNNESFEEEEEELSDHFEEEMKTPAKTPAKKRASFASPNAIAMGTNSPAGPARFIDGDLNPMPYPMMAGYWEKIDFNNNMKSTGYVMVRMIVHPGINLSMVDAKWMSSTILKIRFCWPEFFKSVLQMLAFDVVTVPGTETTVPKFGRDHQLTGSFGKFVHGRMEDDGQVWDEGFMSFDRAMDMDHWFRVR